MLFTSTATRWTKKPPPSTGLDIVHPHCPDHCWPFLSPQGTAQPLCRSQKLAPPTARGDIYAGSSSMVPGRKYGLSVRHGAVTDTTRFTAELAAETSKVLPNSGGFTCLVADRKTDATIRANAVFGTTGSGLTAERCDFYRLYNDGNTYWCFGGVTEGTNQLTVPNASIVAGDDLWVLTTGPRGMEIWQNGKLLGSNGANPTRSPSFATSSFGLSAFVPPSITDLADTALLMTWRRQLTKAAIIELSANPWQVFQPPALFRNLPFVAAPLNTFPSLLLY